MYSCFKWLEFASNFSEKYHKLQVQWERANAYLSPTKHKNRKWRWIMRSIFYSPKIFTTFLLRFLNIEKFSNIETTKFFEKFRTTTKQSSLFRTLEAVNFLSPFYNFEKLFNNRESARILILFFRSFRRNEKNLFNPRA